MSTGYGQGHDSVTLTARVKNPVARRVKAHADLTGRTVSKMIGDMLRAAYGADAEPNR